MADNTFNFDLDAPAVPTLTLDPTPAEEEKAAPAQQEAAAPEQPQVNLTPEEQAMVDQFAEKIDITNSQQVLQYGSACQKKIGDFSEAALSKVATKDLGEVGDMITSLIGELKSFDAGEEEKKGIFVLVKTSNPSSGEFQDQLINGRPLYELVGEKVAAWGADCMGDSYSYVGAVVGATYPEQGKVLRKVMPKAFILVPGYGAQGGKGADLVHFFNEDGLGAIINSSRGIIAAYQQEKYAQFGEQNYADASRAAVLDMREDIAQALAAR